MIALLFALILAAGPSRDPAFQLRYEMGSLQSELLQTKARIESQESVIEALRREMESHLSTNKELVRGTLTESTGKVAGVEQLSKDLASDLVELKKGVEAALAKLEKEIDAQNKSIAHFQTALKAILDAVGGDVGEKVALSADKSYTIKDGDSLGKIALSHGTTVKALKELNNLTKDTIRVGQKLYIP